MLHLPNGYTARPGTLDDVEAIADLYNGNAQQLGAGDTMAASSFKTLLSTPGFDIAASTQLVLGPDNEAVGFIELFDFEEPFTRIWGHAITAINHRGRGIEEALHSWILERARLTIDKAPETARVFIEQVVSSRDGQAIALLESYGYVHTRSYVRMVLNLDAKLSDPTWPDGFTIRALDPDADLDDFLRAKVEAFRDHYGRGDLSDEQQVAFLRHLTLANPVFDPSLYFVLKEGSEIAGICNCYPKSGIDTEAGYIPSVAVRRPWRRRGLALAMLLHAFAELKCHGKRQAVLHVDGESTTGATRLYEKAGMHEDDRNLEYQLTVRPASD